MAEGLDPKPGQSRLAASRPLTRLQKRRLLQQEGSDDGAQARRARACAPRGRRRWHLALYVRWTTLCGAPKVTRLPLRTLSSLDQLQGMFSRLIRHAHRDRRLPAFMTSPDYIVCAPAEEFVSVPSALGSTHFRLVLLDEAGWEHTVSERVLAATPDPAEDLMVTLAEFQSNALDLGDHEVIFNMVSYPTVCILRRQVEAVALRAASRAPTLGEGREEDLAAWLAEEEPASLGSTATRDWE